MKICVIHPQNFKFGGIEVLVKELTRRLEKKGYEIVFPEQKNFTSLKLKRLWLWFKCKPTESDLVHLFDFNLPSLLGKPPVISTFAGSVQGVFWKTKNISAFFGGCMERLRAEQSDVNITVSRGIQKYIKNSIYIPNGVDIKKFKPKSHDIKIETDKIKVLWVGRKEWLKGYYDLPKLTKDFYLLQCLDKPHDEMPKYYNSCDVFILPSHFEGMALTVLEAMACGKPVVAYNVGGLADCIFNGVNGYLVKENDYKSFVNKIKLAYENRKKLGRNGRKLCELIFNWDNVVNQYEDVYRYLLGDSS